MSVTDTAAPAAEAPKNVEEATAPAADAKVSIRRREGVHESSSSLLVVHVAPKMSI